MREAFAMWEAVTDLKFLASHKDSAHIEISFERCSFTPFILPQL